MPALVLPSAANGISATTALRWLDRIAPLVVLATFAGLAIPFHRLDRACEWDDVYLRAALVLRTGGHLYSEVPLYTYPPFMAWLAIPFTWMPVLVSRVLWFAINAACFAGMVWLAWRWVYPAAKNQTLTDAERWQRWAVLGFGLLLGGRAMTNSILHHQTDLVFGMLVFVGIDQLLKSRPSAAAVALGLAAAMKCTPLLWVVFFLWSGPRRSALLLLFTAIVANLLPNLTHPTEHGTWLSGWLSHVLFNVLRPGAYPGQWNVDVITNQSLAGSVYAWIKSTWSWDAAGFHLHLRETGLISPLAAKVLVYGVGAALLLVTLRRLTWQPPASAETTPPSVTQCAMILLLMLLLSPMSHKTHFGLLLVPGFALGRAWIEGRSRSLGLPLAVVMVLQVGSLRMLSVPLAYFASWLGAQMLTTVMLLVACWLAQPASRAQAGQKAKPEDSGLAQAACLVLLKRTSRRGQLGGSLSGRSRSS